MSAKNPDKNHYAFAIDAVRELSESNNLEPWIVEEPALVN